ncbi:hypothetical protein ONZ45_g6446 [Pleurotus djamor]|nr:hypothetical protein ONZ45_g6446 [Pleurotus djamor]
MPAPTSLRTEPKKASAVATPSPRPATRAHTSSSPAVQADAPASQGDADAANNSANTPQPLLTSLGFLPTPPNSSQFKDFLEMRRLLFRKGFYLGDPAVRDQLEWVRDGNAHRLAVYKESRTGPSATAILSVIGEASPDGFYLDWDGNWKPTRFCSDITDTRLSFIATPPAHSPYNDDWSTSMATINCLLGKPEVNPSSAPHRGFVVGDKVSEKLRFRHVLFQRINRTEEGHRVERADGELVIDEDKDGDSDAESEWDDDIDEWNLATWPAESSEAKAAMKELQVIMTHRVVPLYGVDMRGNRIQPDGFRRHVQRAIVAVQFTLTHHLIKDAASGQKHNQFTADIHCIDVLRGPVAAVTTPKKRRNASLRTPTPSPTKRARN